MKVSPFRTGPLKRRFPTPSGCRKNRAKRLFTDGGAPGHDTLPDFSLRTGPLKHRLFHPREGGSVRLRRARLRWNSSQKPKFSAACRRLEPGCEARNARAASIR